MLSGNIGEFPAILDECLLCMCMLSWLLHSSETVCFHEFGMGLVEARGGSASTLVDFPSFR